MAKSKTFGEIFKEQLVERYYGVNVSESPTLKDPPSKIPNMIKKAMMSSGLRSGSRWRLGTRGIGWEEPEYNFELIDKAVFTDSYLRRAVDKYEELCWKNGYSLITTSTEVKKYLRLRMVMHTFSTGQPFDLFLKQISRELIKYHNVLIYRKRFDITEIGPIGVSMMNKIKPMGDNQFPVGAYEILPITTAKVRKDKKNNILGWQQDPGNGETRDFKPEEIIHMKKSCESGNFWGNPFLYPVLEDVKAYRQLEEDAIVISHQMIEPKIVYKVGDVALPSTIIDLDESELSRIVTDLQYMLESGAIVIPGHHSCDVLNTAQTQDISPYMDKLRMRVFGGLGMSPVHFGDSSAGNRSVTDRLDVQLYDIIKGYQNTVQDYITYFMFSEWLIEGGFDVDYSLDDNGDWVRMRFEEIDTDSLIKKQNHDTSRFVQNVISHDEVRRSHGLLPMSDAEKPGLYADMIGEIDAKHEATIDKSKAQQTAGGTNQGSDSKTKVKKTSSFDGEVLTEKVDPKMDDYRHWWEEMKTDTIDYLNITYKDDLKDFNSAELEHLFEFCFTKIRSLYYADISLNLGIGILEGKNQAIMAGHKPPVTIDMSKVNGYKTSINKRVDPAINILKDLLYKRVEDDVKMAESHEKAIEYATIAFENTMFRLSQVIESETSAAYNYGILCIAVLSKIDKVWKVSVDSCELCEEGYVETKYKTIEDIPPLSTHTNCKCRLKIV